MDPDSVSKAFVQHYYHTFDSNRAALVGLYQDGSMLQQCQHKIDTVDCQPSGPQGGVLVFVSGTITTGPGEHPLKFSQMFHLLPAGGSFYVQNDMFRLNYG
ncbi:unnamed protein product [Triticum turgidum subsp. durum]|uniref:NTF2 domain-containing protein n=1 Tax=Triticum turgidum subsp. durum TaxID=4567 RepID=A0A9R0ZCM8_TRITD|nr:unnamed protein product [Triticum turgidum subsp. durum]